ncbi:Inner membrane transport protein YeaN [Corynebacterium capitovis DSM 44611]|uniref:MFS transporter n=1 Tax=Corynebacterium capitovis TaxID=131081 RepID=UPI00039DC2B9|nr:MFS transporter [Corynebacterium capitovis]WKD58020.1 Inner membrane transport protein YeaN [Corynebacterium capitovis DSM 44611]
MGTGAVVRALPITLLFAAVVSAAINLRAGVASVGPVLDQVIAFYGAPASIGGVITSLPGLCFFIFGVSAVPLARQVGFTPALVAAGLAITVGLVLRPFAPGLSLFILATLAVAAGIALANVLLPAWIKQYGGKQIVALTTVYSVTLSLSAAVGPLSALVTDTWQATLGLWGATAVAQLAVWLLVWARVGRDAPAPEGSADGDDPSGGAEGKIYRSRTVVALMFFFGLQSMNAYIQMGWLPAMLTQAGASSSDAAIGLSIIGLIGAGGGLILPTVISRARTLSPLVIAFGLLTAAGYTGVLLAPASAPLFWCVVLGFGGWCFPLAISLIPARTRSALVTARLAGFVQPVGYVLAAAGPFAVGLAYGAVGSFRPILLVLIVLALIMGALGVVAARPVFIEDELRR